MTDFLELTDRLKLMQYRINNYHSALAIALMDHPDPDLEKVLASNGRITPSGNLVGQRLEEEGD